MKMTEEERHNLLFHGVEIRTATRWQIWMAKIFGKPVCDCGANKRYKGMWFVTGECKCPTGLETFDEITGRTGKK